MVVRSLFSPLFQLIPTIQPSPILQQGYVTDVQQDTHASHIQLLIIFFLQTGHYAMCVGHHDPYGLISGYMVVWNDYSCFKVAHIHLCVHDS